jgi:hypothetical protein
MVSSELYPIPLRFIGVPSPPPKWGENPNEVCENRLEKGEDCPASTVKVVEILYELS